jgi:predicted transcriptional regulator
MDETHTPLDLTSRLVSAYVAHNPVPVNDVENLLRAVHYAFASLAAGELEDKPAVAIRVSVTPDYIVCLEDGKRLKTLKRYLRNRFGMTPDDYRAKWKLPLDYPMTAPNYAARRSSLAKSFGLGQRTRKGTARKTRARK